MQIKLKWLPRAIALLDDIYEYYSEKSERSAIRIYNKLLDSAEPLKTFPYAGISEPLLEEFPQFPLPGCRKTLQADLHHQSNPDRDTRHMGLQAG